MHLKPKQQLLPIIYQIPFTSQIKFTDAELALLYKYLKVREIKKKEIILKESHVETTFSFVHKGLLRKFYKQKKKQINVQFAAEGDIVSTAYSYFSGLPCGYYIEALEPTTLLFYKKEDLDFLFSQGLNFTLFGRLLMSSLFLHIEQREKELLICDARQRLKNLIDKNPQLYSRLKQVHIASYLNIQPETFSKLKKKETRV